MSFLDHLRTQSWREMSERIVSRGSADVEAALAKPSVDPHDLPSLLSPAAEPYLEEMARRAHALTQQRFGRTIGLFAPLYLSNECANLCRYCGFNAQNRTERLTLDREQIVEEAEALHALGFRHILLVSGEAPHIVTQEYLEEAVGLLRPLFDSISIEIYPLDEAGYRALGRCGVDGLVIYQETYDEQCYARMHPKGRKRDFDWRLGTPERGGAAGLRRIGIGALLGLSDWRTEGCFLGQHGRYLLKHFWKSHLTISFPRLRPASGCLEPPFRVSDRNLVQLMVALRLVLPDAGLILSTREMPQLRDNLIRLGVTAMSAGSHTEPGGYARRTGAQAQFEIADTRTPQEVAALIRSAGYEPVWKDWDRDFIH